jgi:release factor glutamine methyltransferase
VTASDISRTAVNALKENARRNNASLNIVHSDLFENLSGKIFDIIAVSPPYFKKDPVTEADHAWLCGVQMQYFSRLFETVKPFWGQKGVMIMLLSENCDISTIRQMTNEHLLKMERVLKKKGILEDNYIFQFTGPRIVTANVCRF